VVGWLIGGILRWVAEAVYILGRRPGYDWTTGRRSSLAYRAIWQLGRIAFWLPIVVAVGLLIYLVYFGPSLVL